MKKIDEILEYFKRKNIFAIELTHKGEKIVLAVKIDGNEFTLVILDWMALCSIGLDGLPEYQRNHNFLRCHIHIKEGNVFISDFQTENQRFGYGQILMNYLLKIMEYFETSNSIKFEQIEGKLSFVDKSNENWNKSLPFYSKFPNRIYKSSVYCDRINFELFDKDGNEYTDIYEFVKEAPEGKFYYRIV